MGDIIPPAKGRLVAILVALLVSGWASAPPATQGVGLDAPHADALRQLTEPVVECISRRDTGSPAFHGCYDWHSAVHANLTLRIAARLSGQRGLRRLANQLTPRQAISAERAVIVSGGPAGELPYGYAWLLLLDREAGRKDIHRSALAAAPPLRAWLDGHLPDPAYAAATRYTSSTFAAFAMHRWYARFDVRQGRRFARRAVPRLLALREVACSSSPSRAGFLDACASLLLALSQMSRHAPVPHSALAEMASTVGARAPVRADQLTSIFEAGLNFSRAWALYAAAAALSDASLVQRGDDLFDAQLGQPEMWRVDYAKYSHWVAQFGIFALDLRTEVVLPSAPAASPTVLLPGPPSAGGTDSIEPRRSGPSVWAW